MRRIIVSLIAVASMALVAGSAVGQAANANLTPQQLAVAQAKRAAWDKWNENHKHVQQLGRTVRGLAELEKDPKTALNKAQAKKVLAAFKQWEGKKELTDDEAGKANKAISSVLNKTQIQRLVVSSGGGGRRMGGGMGGGRMGGGARRNFDPSQIPDPKSYNPLNPDTLPFARMKSVAKQRFADLKAQLRAAK